MCEFGNAKMVALVGSRRGESRWFALSRAQVYHDHFIAAQLEGGVVIDLMNNESGAKPYLCLELSAASARALALAILATVEDAAAPQGNGGVTSDGTVRATDS